MASLLPLFFLLHGVAARAYLACVTTRELPPIEAWQRMVSIETTLDPMDVLVLHHEESEVDRRQRSEKEARWLDCRWELLSPRDAHEIIRANEWVAYLRGHRTIYLRDGFCQKFQTTASESRLVNLFTMPRHRLQDGSYTCKDTKLAKRSSCHDGLYDYGLSKQTLICPHHSSVNLVVLLFFLLGVVIFSLVHLRTHRRFSYSRFV